MENRRHITNIILYPILSGVKYYYYYLLRLLKTKEKLIYESFAVIVAAKIQRCAHPCAGPRSSPRVECIRGTRVPKINQLRLFRALRFSHLGIEPLPPPLPPRLFRWKRKKKKREKGKYERLEKIQTVEQPLSEYSRHSGHVSKVWPETRPRVNISRGHLFTKVVEAGGNGASGIFIRKLSPKRLYSSLCVRGKTESGRCLKFIARHRPPRSICMIVAMCDNRFMMTLQSVFTKTKTYLARINHWIKVTSHHRLNCSSY